MGWPDHYDRFRSQVLLQTPAEEAGAGRLKGEDRYQTWRRMAKIEENLFPGCAKKASDS